MKVAKLLFLLTCILITCLIWQYQPTFIRSLNHDIYNVCHSVVSKIKKLKSSLCDIVIVISLWKKINVIVQSSAHLRTPQKWTQCCCAKRKPCASLNHRCRNRCKINHKLILMSKKIVSCCRAEERARKGFLPQ